MPLFRFTDDAIGGVQNLLRRAIVLLERDQHSSWILIREVQNISHRCRTERVDRLSIIADGSQPFAVGTDVSQDQSLQDVRVLILIDHDFLELLPQHFSAVGIFSERFPEEQQVVKIEDSLLFLGGCVTVEEFAQSSLMFQTPREVLLENDVQRLLSVDAATIDVEAGSLQRKPLVRLRKIQLRPLDVHQIFGVAAIQNREVRIQPNQIAVAS